MYEHESKHPCECHVCQVPHFERNNYFHGKTLSARDLTAEQQYFNQKRWLVNRMVLGWGIVCGLEVRLDNGCLSVSSGLALDCCGHELLVCDREAIDIDTIAAQLKIDSHKPTAHIRWALCLEYCERKLEPVKVPFACDQPERGQEHNRIRDHYRLTFRPWRDACPKDHSDDCCPYPGLGHDTSIHQALVKQSYYCPKCEECECVLLATGTLSVNRQQELEIKLDDDFWRYRRIVYTNDALGKLIRCFHGQLAHIAGVNWRWQHGAHYSVDEFLDLLSGEHLRIKFDQSLNASTVTDRRTFRLTIFLATEHSSCPMPLLIPVDYIKYEGDVAVYYFDETCIEYELRRACKRLSKPAEVELVLHGAMVRDEHDHALDAELIKDFPTGNGVQGGEFITYFTVGPEYSAVSEQRRLNNKEASS